MSGTLTYHYNPSRRDTKVDFLWDLVKGFIEASHGIKIAEEINETLQRSEIYWKNKKIPLNNNQSARTLLQVLELHITAI